ncbi:MAG: CoB--CoM heterodisulfide reductase iron-sulfur subunit B family protein [Candidatus Hodarchaeota archaeon]
MTSYAYFAGCIIPYRLPLMEVAARKVLDHFGIEMKPLPFGCCPDPVGIQASNRESWLTLAARNLCMAEEAGLDILTLCNGCFETLKTANMELQHDLQLKNKVNGYLSEIGRDYKGITKVKHVLEVMWDDITPKKISEATTNPLNLKLAIHYGCHLLRPEKIMQVDNALNPHKLETLIEAVGCTDVPYDGKLECCGATIREVNPRNSYGIALKKLESIEKVKADGMVVACPTCFLQFDFGQTGVRKHFNRRFKMPIFYFLELIALGVGIPAIELGLRDHAIKIKI